MLLKNFSLIIHLYIAALQQKITIVCFYIRYLRYFFELLMINLLS